MPDDLTLGGIPVRVRKNSWREGAPWYQGGMDRMGDGSMVSTLDVTTKKRSATCEAYFKTAAEQTAVTGAAPPGTAIAIAGALPSAPFSGIVTFGEMPALKVTDDTGATLHRTVTLTIQEA